MYIAPLAEALITPSLGSLLGTSASADVLSYLNNQYGSQNGVIFGQPGDPLMDRFHNLMNLVQTKLIDTNQMIQQTTIAVTNPCQIQAITSEEQLYNTPVSMQLPILMYAPIRELFEQDRIYGYGFCKENLPQEDVFGRLIDNGKVTLNQNFYADGKIPDYMEEHWESTDPKLTFDELDAIEETREWVLQYLRAQMREGGEMRDPTDPSNKISQPRRRNRRKNNG